MRAYILLVLPLLTAPLLAQRPVAAHRDRVTWNPEPLLGERDTFAMAHDLGRDRIVAFGGQGCWDTYLDDTSEWCGDRWRGRRVSIWPPRRMFHQMAYDPVNAGVLLLGLKQAKITGANRPDSSVHAAA